MLLVMLASAKLLGLVGRSSLQTVVVLGLHSKDIHPIVLGLVFSLVAGHVTLLALVILR